MNNVNGMLRKNILIIDDEEAIREFLERLFKRDFFNVFKASGGEQGLSLIGSVRMDLVLLDLILREPEMDGIEVLKSIRRFSKTVPVIVMTGYSTIERAEMCADLAVQGYIRKPFDPFELLEKVKAMLNQTALSGQFKADRSKSGSRDGLSDLVGELMEIIESHCTELARPRDVAARVFASRDYIGKKFKKETGHSIAEHINRVRVDKAKHLLLEKANAKISAIWQEAGFGSESQFLRMFKRYTGKTAAVFRKSPA